MTFTRVFALVSAVTIGSFMATPQAHAAPAGLYEFSFTSTAVSETFYDVYVCYEGLESDFDCASNDSIMQDISDPGLIAKAGLGSIYSGQKSGVLSLNWPGGDSISSADVFTTFGATRGLAGRGVELGCQVGSVDCKISRPDFFDISLSYDASGAFSLSYFSGVSAYYDGNFDLSNTGGGFSLSSDGQFEGYYAGYPGYEATIQFSNVTLVSAPAVAPVPLSASMGFMLAGLGLLGAVGRRQMMR